MNSPFFFRLVLFSVAVTPACSLMATRPVQEMSDTASAIRAAKEVQADTLSAELYRSSSEWFLKAKREYKYKNFKQAKEYAMRSRRFAELEAIRNGGNRNDSSIQDPLDQVSGATSTKNSDKEPTRVPSSGKPPSKP